MILLQLAMMGQAPFELDLATGLLHPAESLDRVDTETWDLRGDLVAEAGEFHSRVYDGGIEVYKKRRRIRRMWVPHDWATDEVEFYQLGRVAVGWLDGVAIHTNGRGKKPEAVAFGTKGTVPLQVGGGLLDPVTRRWWKPGLSRDQDLPPVELESPVRSGGYWLSSQEGRPIVWNDGGVIQFVAAEPGVGHRLSRTGRLLAHRTTSSKVEVWDVADHRLRKLRVCADATDVWPVGPDAVIADCRSRGLLYVTSRRRSVLGGHATADSQFGFRDGVLIVRSPDEITVEIDLTTGTRTPVGAEVDDMVDGYRRGVLERLSIVHRGGKPVERATAFAFDRMARAAELEGVALTVVSGFRTWEEQDRLYGCYLNGNCNNGNLAAAPGFSHHQSGKALDLSVPTDTLTWLRTHAVEFGFHETVRGEPWHWEYEGPSAALAVSVHDLRDAEFHPVLPALPGATIASR